MWTSFKFYKLMPGTVQRLIWNEPCPQINKANRTTPASLHLEISCGGVDGSDSPSRYTSEGNDNITFTGLRAAVARGSGGSPQRKWKEKKGRTLTPNSQPHKANDIPAHIHIQTPGSSHNHPHFSEPTFGNQLHGEASLNYWRLS